MATGQVFRASGEFSEKSMAFPAVLKGAGKWQDAQVDKEETSEYYKMICTKKGSATILIDGEEVGISPQSVLIIKPGVVHLLKEKSENLDAALLLFQFSQGETDARDVFTDFKEYLQDEENPAFLYVKLSKKNEIMYLANRILRERTKYQIWCDYLTGILMAEMLLLLARVLRAEWEKGAKDRNLKLRELLAMAKDYMDTHFAEDVTLARVAGYVYLSESYFAHSFKDAYGTSPKSYILKVRVEEAQKLLEESDLKISEVASKVGFSSQQRFNEIFRKYTGLTPLKYRQAKRATATV